MRNPNNTATHRHCNRCKNIVPLECFPVEKGRPLGRSYICGPCEVDRSREKYIKNPRRGRWATFNPDQKEKIAVIRKRYSKTPIGRALFLASAYRKTDEKAGRQCDIKKEFLLEEIFPKPCHYCGLRDENIGCDRIDNSLGHLKSNVVPACRTCNCFRSNKFSMAEMVKIGSVIREIKNARASGTPIKDFPHVEAKQFKQAAT